MTSDKQSPLEKLSEKLRLEDHKSEIHFKGLDSGVLVSDPSIDPDAHGSAPRFCFKQFLFGRLVA